MGTKKTYGGLHIIVIGDSYQLLPVMDSYIFKDSPYSYGPLATNLWTTYFQIFSLTEIMQQCGDHQFCEIFNRLHIGEITNDDQTILKTHIINKADSCRCRFLILFGINCMVETSSKSQKQNQISLFAQAFTS